MTLVVYNTLSRKIEEFRPIEQGKVRVYICGLTVYDFMHIGHARTYLAFDSILRYLKYRGYNVRYIQNITDIDDKIINRARQRGLDPLELSREFAQKSLEDQKTMGLVAPDDYPKVSQHIPEIIAAVDKLIKSGHAYQVGQDVYFDVSKAEGYGSLSNQDPQQLTKHRIEPAEGKRNQIDFSLWKHTDDEFGFQSPWGVGRPGWHIECSVMSQKHLGDQVDIHGGALDLIFPHHENEIAQSQALTGKKPFVKYWLHTGFLNSSGEKMSKSLGNILAVREFVKQYSPEAFRLFILQTHYRSPVDYSKESVESAQALLKRLTIFRRELEAQAKKAPLEGKTQAKDDADQMRREFIENMDDDFNTPKALASILEAVRRINTLMDEGGQSRISLAFALSQFDELIQVLGVRIISEDQSPREIQDLIAQRAQFRKLGKWADADRVRDEIVKQGYRLVDRKDGTTIAEKV